MSSLYILEIRPLSEVSLANMFSHTVGTLCNLVLFSLAMQKVFIVNAFEKVEVELSSSAWRCMLATVAIQCLDPLTH